MTEFRDSRIGIRNAALMLGVTVTELREAILSEGTIKGVAPPKPIYNAGRRQSEMMFLAGDVMDVDEKMKSTKDGERKP